MSTLFVRLARVGAILALTVVMLGAWVRLTDAGLGCPDWPGCYGRLVVPHAATSPEELGSEEHRRVTGAFAGPSTGESGRINRGSRSMGTCT